MAAPAFVERLQAQVANEFAASQQYVAVAVHYDAQTLPRLAAWFYAQALEERNHAMMMVQYLMDAGVDPVIPGVSAPRARFAGLKEKLGDAFEVIELDSSPGNADGYAKGAHSVLTGEVRENPPNSAYETREHMVEFLRRNISRKAD